MKKLKPIFTEAALKEIEALEKKDREEREARENEIKPCPFCGNKMLTLTRKVYGGIIMNKTYVSCCHVNEMPLNRWNIRNE